MSRMLRSAASRRMPKRVWPGLFAVLLLASCIRVDDFGVYWDQGVVDSALDGTWQKSSAGVPGSAPATSPAVLTFTRNGSSHTARADSPTPIPLVVETHERTSQGPVQSRPFEARSLRIGAAMFLMLRDSDGRSSGFLEKYDVQGTTLRAYRLEGATDVSFSTLDGNAVRELYSLAGSRDKWRVHAEYKKLAAPAGSSLPPEDRPQLQTVTLFDVSQQREVESQFFIAGVGYVAINGGGSTLAGMNRALDPFIELTIADRRDPALKACRPLLAPSSLAGHAVRISGAGTFTRHQGVNDRQLVVVRLETLSDCKLVDRR